MAASSGIQWTDATWNPIVGCSIVSPGCTNCCAMKMAARIRAASEVKDGASHYCGTVKLHPNGMPIWTGKLALAPDHILTAPLRWSKPRRIFVNSMGDLFHESAPEEWIDRVFAVMALCPQHQFQVLTKRAERMRAYCSTKVRGYLIGGGPALDRAQPPNRPWRDRVCKQQAGARIEARDRLAHWPLPNVWLGVSAERQQEADERLPYLINTPAAVRFVSCEPLLGPILLQHDDLRDGKVRNWLGKGGLDWIIVGGESGPGARPMSLGWARDISDQCKAAGVACFIKQLGRSPLEDINLKDRHGGDWDEWPVDLRVREFPAALTV